jgi:hypothetical protein
MYKIHVKNTNLVKNVDLMTQNEANAIQEFYSYAFTWPEVDMTLVKENGNKEVVIKHHESFELK